jgi:hypothetical protein
MQLEVCIGSEHVRKCRCTVTTQTAVPSTLGLHHQVLDNLCVYVIPLRLSSAGLHQ